MALTTASASFEVTDRLSLRSFSEKLERYLTIESDFVEGSLVAALNAPFGFGKTTFITMWKNDLIKRRSATAAETAFTAPMPVILNAWESDFCGDPLAAILSPLIKAAESWKGTSKVDKQKVRKLKEAAKDAGWLMAGIASGFTNQITGVDPLSVVELKDQKNKERNPGPPDFIRFFDQRQKALNDLRQALEDTFASQPPPSTETSTPEDTVFVSTGSSPKVIVFVDELDRCRPDYAIHYLETIKHVFNVNGIIFLLAVDAKQLEVSAKALFGEKLNFREYFRKFCHRTFNLPEPDDGPLGTLMEELIAKHVTRRGLRNSAFKEGEYIARMTVPLVRTWKLNPRQLHEAFRILGHALAIDGKHGEMRTHSTSASLAYLYLCLIRIAEPEAYHEILTGSFSQEHIRLFFRSQFPLKDDAESWAELYFSGTNMDLGQLDTPIRDKLSKARMLSQWKEHQFKIQDRLGHHPDPFKRICHRIENALMFEEEA